MIMLSINVMTVPTIIMLFLLKMKTVIKKNTELKNPVSRVILFQIRI